MSLSRTRMRERKRIDRAVARGETVTLSQTQALALLNADERKAVLREIALAPTEAPVTAGQRVAAIKELNLMEHVYDAPSGGRQPVATFIFLMPDGQQMSARQMLQAQQTDPGQLT